MFQGRFKSVLILDESRLDEAAARPEVVGRESGVSYAAAAQGIRRFWKRAPNSPEMRAFVAALLDQMANG